MYSKKFSYGSETLYSYGFEAHAAQKNQKAWLITYLNLVHNLLYFSMLWFECFGGVLFAGGLATHGVALVWFLVSMSVVVFGHFWGNNSQMGRTEIYQDFGSPGVT